MNNNIFIKLNKKKNNPDIESKLNNVSNERTQIKFNLSKTIYNPITGIIPDKLISQNDLILQHDKSNIDIKALVSLKENERLEQNELCKPIKTKIINNTLIENPNLNKNVKNDYIKTYNELKNGDIIQKKSDYNYNNILSDLKDLGIIKLV